MGENENQPPTPEQLRSWLTPKQALEMLGWSRTKAHRAIANRLKDGLIRAAAETLITTGPPRSHVELAQVAWKDWYYDGEPLFWTNGDCEFYKNSPSGSYPSGPRAYGVRFHPEGVRRLLEHDHAKGMAPGLFEKLMGADPSPMTGAWPEAPEAVQSSRKAPPTNDEVKAWYRALPKPEKALGLRMLWAKAKMEIGPGVLRKQIEPFVAGRSTGPKGPRR